MLLYNKMDNVIYNNQSTENGEDFQRKINLQYLLNSNNKTHISDILMNIFDIIINDTCNASLPGCKDKVVNLSIICSINESVNDEIN